jgi:isoleucyl-tRNA synthetase
MAAQMQARAVEDYRAYQFHLVTQKLQGFCSEDLGGFYLDILKDRLYTCGRESRARRSAQTALWHIAQSLVKLMAPILSFTAEEAWQVMQGSSARSVFEELWHAVPQPGLDQASLDDWGNIRQVREMAAKSIERKRENKELGSSLQAELAIQGHGPGFASLKRLDGELKFVLLVSGVKLEETAGIPLQIHVNASAHTKCERCWHFRADVNAAGLCGRCESNLHGAGEPRRYA